MQIQAYRDRKDRLETVNECDKEASEVSNMNREGQIPSLFLMT
jgi:hypothetical protein